jgi:hypothetical protein
VTCNIDWYVGATAQEKFRVLSFRVKIQGLRVCLAMALLKVLV